MSPAIEVRPARPTDVGPIANNAREMDVVEAQVVGFTMKNAIRHGITHGDAWTILVGGLPVLMFGVIDVSIAEGKGRVWAVATTHAEARWRDMLRVGSYVLSNLLERYMTLENYVHADNAKAVRWLRWSGFTLGEPVEVNGQTMRRLAICADHQH